MKPPVVSLHRLHQLLIRSSISLKQPLLEDPRVDFMTVDILAAVVSNQVTSSEPVLQELSVRLPNAGDVRQRLPHDIGVFRRFETYLVVADHHRFLRLSISPLKVRFREQGSAWLNG